MTLLSKIMRCAGVIFALLLMPVSVNAASAIDWLQNMSNAMQNENYTGTYVYMQGDRIETLQISHMKDAGGERERLLSLNGEAREVIRDNSNVTCIWPGSQSVTVSKSRPNTAFSEWIEGDLRAITKWYDLSILGEDRVAGRSSTIIGIIPKDKLRYGRKLWIDNESALLLRSQMFNSAGKSIEQVMFTQMSITKELVASQFTPSLNSGNYDLQETDKTEDANSFSVAWVFDDLPAGFQRVSEKIKPMAGNNYATHHVTLSDGLVSVSVYVEPQDFENASAHNKTALLGESQIGAVSAYGRDMSRIHVMVVGEVPMVTAAKIGKSVKLASASQ